jgi:hypothetical protein
MLQFLLLACVISPLDIQAGSFVRLFLRVKRAKFVFDHCRVGYELCLVFQIRDNVTCINSQITVSHNSILYINTGKLHVSVPLDNHQAFI